MSKKLIKDYEDACNAIVARFSKKQGIEFDGWVGDDIGGIASFICQYFFDMHDIVLDLKTNQKKGFIMQWQDDGVDAHFEGVESNINYNSYIMGLRYQDLKTN